MGAYASDAQGLGRAIVDPAQIHYLLNDERYREDMSALVESLVQNLLLMVGENPEREGLRDTPSRVVKAYKEMTRGYYVDVEKLLSTQFDESADEIVILRGIQFTSLCEHHLLPFVGTAMVAYLPGEKVVGLSKLARLVDAYAKRLQVQERMTKEIAESLLRYAGAKGVAVIIKASHQCMVCRGVEKHGAEMITSSILGFFRENDAARAEVLSMLKM